ncbi:UNVERIFIED_CONTAM: putative RNA-binding protein ARP1 [Sesamum radiatum]|uniref:RNA-binding protein ARP1 n=1 Tax=Sesamum radiatum TaxID=300843 RepID=A0AAW2TFR1_SESRA
MTMMSSNNNNNGNGNVQNLGDTTLTKVFVGGLAWETPKEAMRDHFQKYGDILEAVIISDKLTGRSKGYGFVTFKDAEAAKKACEDPTPIINGRRANCNLAALGARRPRSSSTTTTAAAANNPLLNKKLGFSGGSYMNGHFYPGQAMVGANTLMPMYPLYHFHQSQTMGLPAHMYSAGPIPTGPALMSKPASIAPPNAGKRPQIPFHS